MCDIKKMKPQIYYNPIFTNSKCYKVYFFSSNKVLHTIMACFF